MPYPPKTAVRNDESSLSYLNESASHNSAKGSVIMSMLFFSRTSVLFIRQASMDSYGHFMIFTETVFMLMGYLICLITITTNDFC